MSKIKYPKSDLIHLKNVRLLYPNIFTTEIYDGKDQGEYTATFLIPKTNTVLVDTIKNAIEILKSECNYSPKDALICKTCLKDLDDNDGEEVKDYLKGHYRLRAKLKKYYNRGGQLVEARKFDIINRFGNKVIVDKNNNIVTIDRNNKITDDGTTVNEFYSGCYVYAIIDLYARPRVKGMLGEPNISANLRGIKFIRDGERLTSNKTVTFEEDDLEDYNFDELQISDEVDDI